MDKTAGYLLREDRFDKLQQRLSSHKGVGVSYHFLSDASLAGTDCRRRAREYLDKAGAQTESDAGTYLFHVFTISVEQAPRAPPQCAFCAFSFLFDGLLTTLHNRQFELFNAAILAWKIFNGLSTRLNNQMTVTWWQVVPVALS